VVADLNRLYREKPVLNEPFSAESSFEALTNHWRKPWVGEIPETCITDRFPSRRVRLVGRLNKYAKSLSVTV
jgi:hypothetical protein